MNSETSKFQIVLLGGFIFFIVIGVLIFATFQSGGTKKSPTVSIWGVLPISILQPVFESTEYRDSGISVVYTEKEEASFEKDFVEALAEGRGPDMILIPQSLLQKEQNKLITLPYSSLSARNFKDSFIQSSEVLLRQDGFLGLPFLADPLVLYWNRTNFTDAGVTSVPKNWEEVSSVVPKLTVRDQNLNIKKSAISIGSSQNVSNVKEILANLFLQSGNTILAEDSAGNLIPTLNSSDNPVLEAVNFYTSFSNPANANYSWNRSLPVSSSYFNSGNLAMYIGFGSEIANIRARNPNLNFDIATLPQIKGASKKVFANLYLFAIPKQSQHPNDAYVAAGFFTSPPIVSMIAKNTNLAPARRDLLSAVPDDAYKSIFYDSTLYSAVWPDPNPERTEVIFKDMIDSITSGGESGANAVTIASREIGDLLIDGN